MSKSARKPKVRAIVKRSAPNAVPSTRFDEVLTLIDSARVQTVAAANRALIDLYWSIGRYISRKVDRDGWGQGTVKASAEYIRRRLPNARGFSASNLWRMMQFFETYQALPKLAAPLRELHPDAAAVFKDTYLVEFLDLPKDHSEADLHAALIEHLKDFLIELGRDFCFVGSRYPIQVGGDDFELDLLLFHRGLNCLVVIELKIDRFRSEYLGKLNFYLESLDRNVKKPHENPAIGVLLFATKNEEVVEYALSRSASSAVIAEYQTRLPDKQLLRSKLHEFYESAQEHSHPKARRRLSQHSSAKSLAPAAARRGPRRPKS